MTSRKLSRKIVTGITVLVTVFTIAATGPAAEATTGAHYIDCGSTAASLGTVSAPWNSFADVNAHTFGPGDTLNLRAGTTCSGRLAPSGSGTTAAPILIQSYGSGARPKINGAGADTAILLRDVSNWTVRGIEVTNPSTTRAQRTGIMYESTTSAAKAGVVIDDVYVHDVAGWGNKDVDGQKYVLSAGIAVKVVSGVGAYAGVRITNSTIEDTGGGGIKLMGDTTAKHTNVYIGDNTIREVGGDGIVVHNSQSPLVERNTALDLGLGAYPLEGGNFAGMWPYNSSDPVFQFNVVGGSRVSKFDSTAWDCDHNVTGTCTYQYNYSYGNGGGFYLNCLVNCSVQSTATDVILRYNIAQDDCRLVLPNGGTGVHYVYNNTFYCPSKPVVDTINRNIVWKNNLVVSPSGSFATGTGVVFSKNAVSGGVTVPSSATGTVTADPGLTAPGSARQSLDSTSGYRLAAGSALLGAGEVIAGNGGRDFFGNPVSATAAPNIGAYNGPGIAVQPAELVNLFNQTAVTTDAHRNGGAVYTSGRSFSGQSLEAAGYARGAALSAAGFDFTWHEGDYGLPDNVKSAGQQVAIGETGRYIGVLGFGAGGTTAGTATVHFADGSTRTVTLSLSDWFDSSPRFGNTQMLSAPSHNIWSEPYNSGSFGKVGSTASGTVKVWVATIDLGASQQIASISLPSGSLTTSAGLHVFGVDTR
ncbi:right-handed parallel beta-helix repeat-containing protein [Microbacterium sp. LWH12-1.2]|uniref:right-handed parallel beta-helix repeat-containing protein n=1 Tax=Microbacterium sp. LWH12-1.2 TaxID=3135259 RepID=UPI0034413EEB